MTTRDVSRLSAAVTNDVRPDSTERIKAALELALRAPAGPQSDRNPDDKTSVQRSDVMSGANMSGAKEQVTVDRRDPPSPARPLHERRTPGNAAVAERQSDRNPDDKTSVQRSDVMSGAKEQVTADRRDPPSPARPLHERRTPGNAAVEDARRWRIEERLEEPPQPPVVEPRRPGKAFGVMARLVAAIGVAAITALFVVKMMPAAQHRDERAAVPDAGQSVTTALPQPPTPPEAPRKPALAEFEALQRSGPAPAAEPEQADKPSDKALQQFLQWSGKTGERAP
jgi:hypothetical protein